MACPSMNEFYRNRGIFITGATGFIGKVLLEKLLYSCPDIRVIYILIREKRGKDVQQRLNEILNSKLFDRIKAKNHTLLDKIIPINGDVTLPLCGLDSTDIELMATTVSVVFNVAASIKFEEPIKEAIKINLMSVRHLLQLCKKLQLLSVIIHVSTAYSNCTKLQVDETISKPHINPSDVIEILDNFDTQMAEKICPTILKDFPNTYTFTKHLAEYLFIEEGKNLPLAIVRPGAVTCAWKDPFPGWIDSRSAWGGLGIALGMGISRYLYGNSKLATHVVPVDLCVNMFITVARETALNYDGEIRVYHCTSGGPTKISSDTFIQLWIKHSSKYPLSNMVRVPSARTFKSYYAFRIFSLWDYYTFLYPMDWFLKRSGQKAILKNAFDNVNENLVSLEYFSNHEWTFANSNSKQLWESLTTEEQKIYNFDLKQIDWSQHLENYVYGCKVYHLQEKLSSLPASRRRYKNLLWASRLWTTCKWTLLLILCYKTYNRHYKVLRKLYYSIYFRIMALALQLMVSVM